MARIARASLAAAPLTALAALLANPLSARDSLGVYDNWAAFRDPAAPRCYAIAKPQPSRLEQDYAPFVAIGTWPDRSIRGQVHVRLARKLARGSTITAIINARRFALTGGGGDAWAQDAAMDAAMVAAMRSGSRLIVSATDSRGRRFSSTYDLAGAATAIDAATVGCTGKRR